MVYKTKRYSKFQKRANRKYMRKRKRYVRKSTALISKSFYIPKTAFVKLPFTALAVTPALAQSQFYTLAIWGSGITCPLTTSQTGVPANGDKYPLGLKEYASFYQHYRVLGASCKVQLNGSGGTPLGSYYCTLLTSSGRPFDTNVDSNYQRIISASTEDLMSYPGAKTKLMSQQNGSNSNIYLKCYGKTKTILGLKDTLDNEELIGLMPGTNTSLPNGNNPYDPRGSWFFVLRIDPAVGDSPASTVQMIIKVKYYVQLLNRDYNNQGTAEVEEQA